MIHSTSNSFKRIFTILSCFLFIQFSSAAQAGDWTEKISWNFSVQKIDESHATIVANVSLAQGWHIFSVNHDPSKADLTGFPTKFVFTPSKNYKLVGKLRDGKKAIVHNDDLGTSLYHEGKSSFKQDIEILTDGKFDINFLYQFQVCDENGCLFPPDQDGKVSISGYKAAKTSTDPAVEPGTTPVNIDTAEAAPESQDSTARKVDKDGKESPVKENKKDKKSDSLWVVFILGFGGGLLALLTPCVFPMIPMTVTFFTKQSKTRSKGIANALIYGFSIIVIYVTIGLIITAIMGPSGLNDLSTNVWMNMIFFAIFLIFAFSFLGAFEIRLPNSWVNKADLKADKGGLVGIFFMAFTLSLVSFSCTGPIIGTLLVESSESGSLMGPAFGMIGFSSALAIPFTLFAIFPGWLNSLPQSGGWLNSVKVVLGLLELALSLKFLSGVDLAYHWDILTREVFVAIWVIIFIIIGIYLLGMIRFSHDSVVERLSVTRFMFALFSLVFALYLLPGMWGAPLKLIDGVAPPIEHSEDNFKFVKGSPQSSNYQNDPLMQEYRSEMHEVGNLLVFHDLEIAKEYAAKAKKPILIDFTGYNCANCRRTESTVWTNDAINPILLNDVVIVSLYVDDRAPLPESEWKYSDAIKGTIRTVGNKWSDYQVRKYKQLSQPLYIVTDSEGNDLTEAVGYTPDINEYQSFLKKGINRFKEKN